MAEKILMKGNEAIAYSAIRNGVDGYFGYPITPQSEVMETLMAEKPWETTGMVVLQAESETASINMVYGGGQEFGLRSGTENVAGIMAMLAAAEEIDVSENYEKVSKIKAAFVEEIKCDGIESLSFESSSPYILMLLCAGVNGETLVRMLEDEVIVGRGSACSSKKAGNHVLEAMKISLEKIKGALRVSFDASLTLEETKSAAKIIKEKYQNLAEKMK